MSSNPKSKAQKQKHTEKIHNPMADVKPNGKVILIVEDEEAMGRVLCQKFERQGFAAVRAVNGVDALEKMKEECFDLVILDLLMPGKDGFAVLQERDQGKCGGVPVFVLTNLGDEDVLKRAEKMGASQCFTKANTSLNDLVTKVKERLNV